MQLKEILKEKRPFYQSGAPLLLEAYAVYERIQGGPLIAQLKWRNVSDKVLQAVSITVHGMDSFGALLEDTACQYIDLAVPPQAVFGTQNAIKLANTMTRAITITLHGVSFADGSIWRAESGTYALLPEAKALPFGGELLSQLKRDLAEKQINAGNQYALQTHDDLWQCGCGNWQKQAEAACHQCKGTMALWQALTEQGALQQRLTDYEQACKRQRVEEEARQAEARAKAEAEAKAEEARRTVLRAEREAEKARLKQKRRRTKRALLALLLVAAACAAGWYFVLRPANLYSQAQEERRQGRYAQANKILTELGDYKDSVSILKQMEADQLFKAGQYASAYELYALLDSAYHTHEAQYAEMYEAANALVAMNRLDEAKTGFSTLGKYADAEQRAAGIAEYLSAVKLMGKGDIRGAHKIFSKSSLFDSKERLAKCNEVLLNEAQTLYKKGDIAQVHAVFAAMGDEPTATKQRTKIEADHAAAQKAMDNAQYDEAIALLIALHNYADSELLLQKAYYDKANALVEAKQYQQAIEAFNAAKDYQDSPERILQTQYALAEDCLIRGDKIAAEAALAKAGGYADAAERLPALQLDIAEEASASKVYDVALSYYTKLPQTDELKAKEYQLAQICHDEGAFEQAVAAYALLGQYELSLSRLPVSRYAWANQLFEKGAYEQAATQFALLGNMTDSAKRAVEASYQWGLQTLEANAFDEAKAIFASIKDTEAAANMMKECDYRMAKALMEQADYQAAATLFDGLSTYADSKAQSQACRYALAEIDLKAGAYAGAMERYRALGSYLDSETKVKQCLYAQAEEMLAQSNHKEAEALYAQISDYSDSKAKISQCRIAQGDALFAVGYYRAALSFYTDLDEDKCAECHIGLGKQAAQQGNIDLAVREYALAAHRPAVQDALYELGKAFATTNDNRKAIETLWLAGDHALSQKMIGEIGDLQNLKGDKQGAAIAYCALITPTQAQADIIVSIDTKTFVEEAKKPCIAPGQNFYKQWFYQQGKAFMLKGDYARAYASFARIEGYKDVDALIANDEKLTAAALEAMVTVGSTIAFGRYEQDNNSSNGAEAIEWRVLAREGKKALVISVAGLDCVQYNTDYTDTTWETSTLRTWMNDTFLNTAFTQAEQQAILTTKITTPQNPSYSTDPGNDTSDKVFCLSIQEAKSLFAGDSERQTKVTAYAKKQGAWTNKNDHCFWWFRSPGHSQKCAASVYSEGSVYCYGWGVDAGNTSVRPALWLELSSDIF